MEFSQDVIDEGVTETHVCGIASIDLIGVDQVRVTYFKARRDGKTVAAHHIIGRRAFFGMLHVLSEAQEAIRQEFAKPAAGADESRQAMH